MSRTSHLEKTCPECEEEMNPIHDKDKKLAFWECTECGKVLLSNKEKP